jgi:hypothetical protein
MHDSPVMNRYDNPQPVSANLKLSWEVKEEPPKIGDMVKVIASEEALRHEGILSSLVGEVGKVIKVDTLQFNDIAVVFVTQPPLRGAFNFPLFNWQSYLEIIPQEQKESSLQLQSWEVDVSKNALLQALKGAGYYVRSFPRKDSYLIEVGKLRGNVLVRNNKPFLEDVVDMVSSTTNGTVSIAPRFVSVKSEDSDVIDDDVNWEALPPDVNTNSVGNHIRIILPLQRQEHDFTWQEVRDALTAAGYEPSAAHKTTGGYAFNYWHRLGPRQVTNIINILKQFADENLIKHTGIPGGGSRNWHYFRIARPILKASLETLDQLDWEIEKYVEGASLSKSSSLQLFSFTYLLLQRRCAYLQTQGNVLVYQDFAQEVKDFVDEKFQDLLERHPEAKEHLNSLSLEFTLRPEEYRDTIGAEYYPQFKTIGYYLPPETLDDNWSGVVHEIVHALQDFFQDTEPSLTSPPEVTSSYLADKNVYRRDVGEKQAYSVEQEFKDWVTTYASA